MFLVPRRTLVASLCPRLSWDPSASLGLSAVSVPKRSVSCLTESRVLPSQPAESGPGTCSQPLTPWLLPLTTPSCRPLPACLHPLGLDHGFDLSCLSFLGQSPCLKPVFWSHVPLYPALVDTHLYRRQTSSPSPWAQILLTKPSGPPCQPGSA